ALGDAGLECAGADRGDLPRAAAAVVRGLGQLVVDEAAAVAEAELAGRSGGGGVAGHRPSQDRGGCGPDGGGARTERQVCRVKLGAARGRARAWFTVGVAYDGPRIMITGVHAIIFTTVADAVRAFLGDCSSSH